MKLFGRSPLVVVGILFAICAIAVAEPNPNWEWEATVRLLDYSFDWSIEDVKAIRKFDPHLTLVEFMSKEWREWVREAVKIWNGHNTGWVLREVPRAGRLRFAGGCWDDGTLGQLFNWGWKCENGLKVWERGMIIVDTREPCEGASNQCRDVEGEAWSDKAEDMNKLHPVRVLLHEIGHALLLDHEGTDPNDIMYGYQCIKPAYEENCACGKEARPLRKAFPSRKDDEYAKKSAETTRPCDKKDKPFGPTGTDLWPFRGWDVIGYLLFSEQLEEKIGFDVNVGLDAISQAIYRDQVVFLVCAKGFLDWANPLLGLVPPWYAGAFSEGEECQASSYAPEHAAATIRNLGLQGQEISLLVYNQDIYKDIALLLESCLTDVGIQIRLKLLPWGEYWHELTSSEPTWDACLFVDWEFPGRTWDLLLYLSETFPEQFESTLSGGVSELLEEAAAAETSEERDHYWQKVQCLVRKSIIPLFAGRWTPQEEEPTHP